MKNENTKDLTPNAAKLIESLRYLTYTNCSAIADIIDNSLDALADNIYIDIADNNIISILDDGFGMDENKMYEAIKLGSDTEKDQSELGRFGMGLVTASISMARRIEVLSKQEGGILHKVVLDLDYIVNTNKWETQVSEVTPTDILLFGDSDHGTLVRILKVDKLDGTKNVLSNKLSNHISERFHKFIEAGKNIVLNGKKIIAYDPLERDKDDTAILIEEDIETKSGKVHVVVAHLNPSGSEQTDGLRNYSIKNQGFYIVRNNREIDAGSTLNGLFTKHNYKNRFRAEISYSSDMDSEFGINFTKDQTNLSQSLIDKIGAIVNPYIKLIEKSAQKKTNVAKSEQISHTDAEDIIKNKKSLLRSKTDWKEKRNKPEKRDNPKTGLEIEPSGKKRKRVNIRTIQTGSRGLQTTIKEADFGQFGPLFEYDLEGSNLVISWNISHPFHSKLIAKYSGDSNVTTPVDLLIYAVVKASLDMEEDQQAVLDSAISAMSSDLRILMK